MGYIVFAAGVPHAPGLAGLFDAAPPHVQDIVRDLYDTLARRLREARPDVLIVFANDHLANSRVRTYPDFLIGMAPEHSGPFEWFKEWIDCRDYTVPGNPEVAEALLRGLGRRGHRMFAERANLKFDDNISVPTVLTDLDRSGISLVPVLQNCTVPPMPDQNACYATGKALRSVIEEDLDPGLRVALLGSGGLSHEPGGSRYYFIDEAFDRWFLELAASGDHARLLRELTLKRMQQSGAGGTCELLAWVVVMGAIGACRGQASGYAIHTDFKCGIGGVFWDLTTETLSSAEATVSPPDRSKANCTPSGGSEVHAVTSARATFDPSLAGHDLVQDLKWDPALRVRFATHEAKVLDRYPLRPDERAAIERRDFRALYDLGFHPYLGGQLARLIYGNTAGKGAAVAVRKLVESLGGASSEGYAAKQDKT